MSVVKDRYVERFVERIENTVVHVVDDMDLNSLQQYAIPVSYTHLRAHET